MERIRHMTTTLHFSQQLVNWELWPGFIGQLLKLQLACMRISRANTSITWLGVTMQVSGLHGILLWCTRLMCVSPGSLCHSNVGSHWLKVVESWRKSHLWFSSNPIVCHLLCSIRVSRRSNEDLAPRHVTADFQVKPFGTSNFFPCLGKECILELVPLISTHEFHFHERDF